MKRAEEHKEKGNSNFKQERYERALKEYDMSLECLITVAYDKSIVLGKRKWNDVVVMRSTVHLNKSTCHYKLERWQRAADEANECLVGNIRDEQMFTDPHIRNKVKQAEKNHGRSDVTLVEQRLPRPVRSKAWFRLSRCYTQLEYVDRAREAMAKALEMCDDDGLLAEMTQHSLRIDVLERQQKERQKKQFKGFWDKLQDRGGYVEQRAEREKQRKAEWDSLNYEERFSKIHELDDSEEEDDMPPVHGGPAPKADAFQADFEDYLRQSLPPGASVQSATEELQRARRQGVDRSFDAYQAEKAQQDERAAERRQAAEARPARPQGQAPPRPERIDEVPLRWLPGQESRTEAAAAGPGDAAEAWAQRQEEAARKERLWRMDYERRKRSEEEDEELRKARERVLQQELQKAGQRARRRLDALDESSSED